MIQEITQYVGNNTNLEVGKDLFAGFIPPTAQDEAVVIIESGGATEHELPDYVEKAIQVLSRDTVYWKARNNAQTVCDLLHGSAGITLPIVDSKEYYMNVAQAITAPQSLGQDAKGLWQISTNYILRIQEK